MRTHADAAGRAGHASALQACALASYHARSTTPSASFRRRRHAAPRPASRAHAALRMSFREQLHCVVAPCEQHACTDDVALSKQEDTRPALF
jgi:hypothetical protein